MPVDVTEFGHLKVHSAAWKIQGVNSKCLLSPSSWQIGDLQKMDEVDMEQPEFQLDQEQTGDYCRDIILVNMPRDIEQQIPLPTKCHLFLEHFFWGVN